MSKIRIEDLDDDVVEAIAESRRTGGAPSPDSSEPGQHGPAHVMMAGRCIHCWSA